MKTKNKTILRIILILFFLWNFQTYGYSQNDTLRKVTDTINGIYIPINLEDCFIQINSFWQDTTITKVRSMTENEFLGNTHHGFGMWIRNNWGLWGGSRLSVYFNDMGIYHPDDMSGIILTSYYRNLTDNRIKLSQQIRKTKKYWKKFKREQKKREKVEQKELKIMFKSINVGDTIEFNYDYEFISQAQEDKWMDNLCIAKGIVLDKKRKDLLLKIKLIEGCDKAGIIIFQGDIYQKEEDKWILVKKNKKEIMKVGEIKWLKSNLWYPLDY